MGRRACPSDVAAVAAFTRTSLPRTSLLHGRCSARCVGVAAALSLFCGLAPADTTQREPERRNVAPTSTLQGKVERALQDAARRTQLDAAQLRVTLSEAVTWPDGALGCPEPGRQYTQVLVSGFRIRIQAGGRTLDYHASLRGEPFLCPEGRIQAPALKDPRI
jgi:hypothetical protein